MGMLFVYVTNVPEKPKIIAAVVALNHDNLNDLAKIYIPVRAIKILIMTDPISALNGDKKAYKKFKGYKRARFMSAKKGVPDKIRGFQSGKCPALSWLTKNTLLGILIDKLSQQ